MHGLKVCRNKVRALPRIIVEQDFSSDDKRPNRAAREMAAMHRSINDQLAKMQNLGPRPQGHFINCSTCHRGAVDPMASDR